jgi:hypothetical protein
MPSIARLPPLLGKDYERNRIELGIKRRKREIKTPATTPKATDKWTPAPFVFPRFKGKAFWGATPICTNLDLTGRRFNGIL